MPSGVNLLEPPVAITDPQLLLPSVSTRFTLGLDDPAATEVVVRNAGTDIANVTVAAYDAESTTSANRVPFATVTMQIPVGGKFGRFASQVLQATMLSLPSSRNISTLDMRVSARASSQFRPTSRLA